jgi:hypothetical protein
VFGIDLISSSARLAGILASGETLSGNETSDALLILQQMMDEWQADGLKIFCENINTFPFVLGQQTYTLGTGGNFSMPRPEKISRMGCQILSNPTQPSEVPITMLDVDGWANVRVKNIAGSYPLFCYPDYQFNVTAGNATMNLNFWVIPGLACNCVIYSWQPLSTWPDLSTTNLTFPAAYIQAIKYNLAVLLANEFQAPQNPGVMLIANNSLQSLKEINLPAPILRCDPGLSGTGVAMYDWRSDTMIIRR